MTIGTTIRISRELLEELKKRKMTPKETYEGVIWDILEDTIELSEETKRELKEAREEVKKGETYTLAEVKKELGL